MNPRVAEVRPLTGYRLRIIFDNDETRIFDCTNLLDTGIFNELKDEAYFKLAREMDGTIIWPHGQDLCPDTLYLESEPI